MPPSPQRHRPTPRNGELGQEYRVAGVVGGLASGWSRLPTSPVLGDFRHSRVSQLLSLAGEFRSSRAGLVDPQERLRIPGRPE